MLHCIAVRHLTMIHIILMCATATHTFPTFKTRTELAAIFDAKHYTRGAELGVQSGGFARHNLERWKACKDYLLVDIWRQQRNYVDLANVDNANQEILFKTTLQNIRPFESKTRICRNLTANCVKFETDGWFDVVYVDARHNYQGAMDDMLKWWPKIKAGGVLAGHDYMDAREVKRATPWQDWSLNEDGSTNNGAVKGAVNDFAARVGRQVVVAYREPLWNSWVIAK